jgi:hypothetical protein
MGKVAYGPNCFGSVPSQQTSKDAGLTNEIQNGASKRKWKTTPGLSGLARSIRASDVNRQNLLFSLAWLVNSTRL